MLIMFVIYLSGILFANGQKNNGTVFKDLKQFTDRADKSAWKLAREKDQIQLQYRKLSLDDTLKVREMRVLFQTVGSLNDLMRHIKHPEGWNEGIRQYKLLESKDSVWISHTVYDIPKPLNQQDLVAQYSVQKNQDSTIILSYPIPYHIAPLEGIKREQFHLSRWVIKPLKNAKLEICFSVISLSNSSIPKFIKDPIVQRMFLNSFSNLKYLLENRP